jgi:hypothetical protein
MVYYASTFPFVSSNQLEIGSPASDVLLLVEWMCGLQTTY